MKIKIEVPNCNHCPFAEYTSTETRESFFCNALGGVVLIGLITDEFPIEEQPLPDECPMRGNEIIVKLK